MMSARDPKGFAGNSSERGFRGSSESPEEALPSPPISPAIFT